MKRPNFINFLAFILSGLMCVSLPNTFGQTTNPNHGRIGAVPLSPDQFNQLQKNHYRIKNVFPNRLRLSRINLERARKGRALIDSYNAVADGQDLELVNDYNAKVPQPAATVGPLTISGELPQSVDNSAEIWFPPIGNQGITGSCQSWASTYYQLTYENARLHGWNVSNNDQTKIFSPKWTYNLLNGGGDEGTEPTYTAVDVYPLLINNGAATLSEFPWDGNTTQWDLNPNDWQSALSSREATMNYVSDLSQGSDPASVQTFISTIQGLLANGYVLTFGTYVGSYRPDPSGCTSFWKTTDSNYATTVINPTDSNAADQALGGQKIYYWQDGGCDGHVMTIVGYNNNVGVNINGTIVYGAFKVANSWGPGNDMTNHGFMWISYDALYAKSQVTGGPSDGNQTTMNWTSPAGLTESFPYKGRWPIFWNSSVYQVTMKQNNPVNTPANYSPKMIAKFTVDVNPRNALNMGLGTSAPSASRPSSNWSSGGINNYGGPLAFNGSESSAASANTATFVLDFTDLLPGANTSKKYYLEGLAGTLLSYQLIDLTTNTTTTASSLSITGGHSAPITYTYADHLPPTALITVDSPSGPLSGTDTLTVVFDCNSSTAETGYSISSCNWNFGDGSTGVGGYGGSTVTHTYTNLTQSTMLFNVTLTVTDSDGGTANYTLPSAVTLGPLPNPPVAKATLTKASGASGLTGAAPLIINYDASSTTDAGGTITNYAWNFGDGSTGSGVTTSHTFTTPGSSYTGSLTVTDSRGATSSLSLALVKTNSLSNAPKAILTVSPTTATTSQTVVTFDGSTSTDTGGTITYYNWNFGDGNTSTTTTSSTTYTYNSPGTFKAQLQVLDNRGITSTWTRETTVTVTGAAGSTAPTISTQPINTTVTAGATATFTAAANGNPTPTYQWMLSTNSGSTWDTVSGATSATLTLNNTTTSMNGYEYEVVATNSAGSATSNAATLTVNAAGTAPDITTQPIGSTITVGSSTTLSVTATGTTPLSYQWYLNGNAITGASGTSSTTPATFTYTTPTSLTSGSYSYTVIVSNHSNSAQPNTLTSATSNPATLTVNAASTAPVITNQPTNQTQITNGVATFTVTATGTPTPTYQWQVSTNGGSSWTTITGATSASYTTGPAPVSMNGNEYNVIVRNSGGSVTSNAATLYVEGISSEPSNVTVAAGSPATFTVVATQLPTAPTYQWWLSSNGGISGSPISGATNASYTINATTASMNGNQYYLIIEYGFGTPNAISYYSNVVTLTVNTTSTAPGAPTIGTATAGNAQATVSFTAPTNNGGSVITGYTVTSNPGNKTATGTTSPITVTDLTNGTAYTFTVTATNAIGTSVASGSSNSVTPQAASTAPVITTQPVGGTILANVQTLNMCVTATGTAPLNYQWYLGSSAISGATNNCYATSIGLTPGSYNYTVTVSNAAGSVTSNTANVTVVAASAPVITTQPVNTTATAGATTTFTAAASGNPTPTYQWMLRTTASGWTAVSGATSTTLTIAHVTTSMSGYQYELVATNSGGSATSNVATLTVNTTNTAPGAPTIGTATAGNAQATVSFTAPSNNGGSAITSYTATSHPGNKTATATESPITVTGLTNGTAYTFTVTATNAIGTSPASSASNRVTPQAAAVAPSFTTQPVNTTVSVGTEAIFTAAASGNPTPTYQWMISTDQGNTWSNISGATATRLIIRNTTVTMNGYEYKLVATNSVGSATSNSGTLTVNPIAPSIVTQPANKTVTASLEAVFIATATGNPTPSYQWMQSTDHGNSWSAVSGAQSTRLILSDTTTSMSGYEYELVATNSGGSATSNPATLTVNPAVAPVFTTQPASTTVTADATAFFVTVATGTPAPTFQWMQSTNNGQTWINITNATEATLTLTNTKTSMNGYQYKVIATNAGGSVTSNAVTLTVKAAAGTCKDGRSFVGIWTGTGDETEHAQVCSSLPTDTSSNPTLTNGRSLLGVVTKTNGVVTGHIWTALSTDGVSTKLTKGRTILAVETKPASSGSSDFDHKITYDIWSVKSGEGKTTKVTKGYTLKGLVIGTHGLTVYYHEWVQ